MGARLILAVDDMLLWLGKKTKKKREKAKSGPSVARGPWLKKLHMFDNSIDHSEKEQLTRFLELLCMWVYMTVYTQYTVQNVIFIFLATGIVNIDYVFLNIKDMFKMLWQA